MGATWDVTTIAYCLVGAPECVVLSDKKSFTCIADNNSDR